MIETKEIVDTFGFSLVCSVCGLVCEERDIHPASGDKIAYCNECGEAIIARELAAEKEQNDRAEANLKAMRKRHQREREKLAAAQAVVLSDRKEHENGAITYTALSSDGVTTYTVTYLSGKSTGCTCISHQPCKHRLAVELREAFLAEWDAEDEEVTRVAEQVASAVLGSEFAEDLAAHVEDSIASGEFAGWAVLTKEQRREAYRNMYPDDFYYAA